MDILSKITDAMQVVLSETGGFCISPRKGIFQKLSNQNNVAIVMKN